MSAEQRLVELGIVLPEPAAAGGNYVPAKTVGDLVFLSGVISAGPDGIVTGTMGGDGGKTMGRGLCGSAALWARAVSRDSQTCSFSRRSCGSRECERLRERGGWVPGFAESGEWLLGSIGGGLRGGGPTRKGGGWGECASAECAGRGADGGAAWVTRKPPAACPEEKRAEVVEFLLRVLRATSAYSAFRFLVCCA